MEFDRKAVAQRGVKNPFGLCRIETNRLTKRIDGIGQARGGDRRKGFIAYEIYVGIGITRVLRRQCVRAQERRTHIDAGLLGNRPGNPQLFEYFLGERP